MIRGVEGGLKLLYTQLSKQLYDPVIRIELFLCICFSTEQCLLPFGEKYPVDDHELLSVKQE